jgi:hypothetical protein
MPNSFPQAPIQLPGMTGFYRGKVRDVYFLEEGRLVMVASDRISAFDVVLPAAIPRKGEVLNRTAAYFLEKTRDLVPNWLISSPHPRVSYGYRETCRGGDGGPWLPVRACLALLQGRCPNPLRGSATGRFAGV